VAKRKPIHTYFFIVILQEQSSLRHLPPIRTDLLPVDEQGVQDSVSFILHPHISGELFQTILTTLWFIWRARNEQRFKQKTWTVWQVHHATAVEIQNTKLVNFIGDDQNPTTTAQLEELDEQSTTMAEQLQKVNCYVDASIPPEQ
jgi:hypothetical protein